MIAATSHPVTARPTDPKIDVLVSQLQPADGGPARALVRLGGKVLHRLSIIDGYAARIPRSALGAFEATPGLRWVSPNRNLRLQAQYGQDSGGASAAYTDAIRASKAWSMNNTGSGVTVAVVDTGVNTDADLAGQVVQAVDFTGEQDNSDNYGHGTFVAGLIAGNGADSGGQVKGVAPGADIVSIKIAGRDGSTDVTRVLEALEWIEDFASTYGIRVVNLSLGFYSTQSATIDPLDFAIERVWNSGIVVITAAGNNGGTAPDTITTPGNDPLVVTVGASYDHTTAPINDDTMATFSSRGPTVDGVAKPDLVAPGKSVVSSRSPGSNVDIANPNSEIGASYARGSGTSFSTAIVSGVVALMLGRTRSLTPDQVKHRLMSTARVIGGATTPATGSGEVDAFAATMTTDLLPANQGVVPALGGGSLQATRGPACLLDSNGSCMSDADADALLGFDSSAYFSSTWAGSQWVGSQWVGAQWVGSAWLGGPWLMTE